MSGHMGQLNGIVIVDKPKGMTSHDVVDVARKVFNTRTVGHAGTLDPAATGVLVLLVGSYTKRSIFFSSEEKEYLAKMRLGVTTDTQDSAGMVTGANEAAIPSPEETIEAVMSFVGEIEQVPPMYSAVKHSGKPLYKLARRGISVSREPKKVAIKKINIREIDLPYVSFDVTCSKGTYIRQLCYDIGQKLGCGAYLAELRRLRCGRFHISQALSLDRLTAAAPAGILFKENENNLRPEKMQD